MSSYPPQKASGADGGVSAEAVIGAQPYRAGRHGVLSLGALPPLRHMALPSASPTGTPGDSGCGSAAEPRSSATRRRMPW
jgi:hypothetical protein